MNELRKEDRQSLVNMLVLILQTNPPLTHLNLRNFDSQVIKDTEIGEQIMELLCGS